MPEAFISAVTESGLLDDPIAFSEKVSTLRLLRPAWDAQNARAAGKAAKRGKRGKREAAGPDTHTALEMYTDFFTSGGLTNAPTPVSFLDILRYPNTRLESDHSYIQFLFPTDSTSSYNPSAPPLPAGFRHALMTTPGFGECCIMGVRRMMVFWGFQHRGTSSTGRPLWRLAPNFTAEHHGWTRRVDHNHLRINRAIRFMRLVGGDRIARAVYRCVMAAIRERNLPVNKRSRRLWRRAALGPMSMDPLAKNFPPDANFWTDSDLDEDEVIVVPRPDLNDSDDDDQEGPEGGADPLLVAGPETFTPGSHPASQATEQSGSKRPSDSTDDDGWHKRQRLQPAWGVPTDSLESSPGFDWDREMHLFKTLRRAGHAEDRPAHHDNGGPEEDLYAADYSSSSEGFLDPHERDEDFIPKRLPFSPIGPMTQSQDIQQTAERYPLLSFLPSFLPSPGTYLMK
ncbi:hypothetical protein C7212DRAFT_361226 [Tuber magnatum]|uniref:Opioid growth factor receptor (OGFr) conserved domain-containing protein n=1 Tax=Tuber magnatum TaxID=42249 RepID=A0A317T104_9PEZI|nr:hypothetical protein C7212DRAFT_361226 [Tuber magnatum]